MPIYESDTISREELEKKRKTNKCAVCGEWLNMFLDTDKDSPNFKQVFLACKDWQRTHHDGIAREYLGEFIKPIIDRREDMVNEHGKEKTTALDKSRIPLSGALTQPQAMHILKLVYPKAPEDDIVRTAIFCRDFGLHPLANEVYLIPYKDKWVMVVGIPANRKMAHNLKGEFSFLDDTPRAANEEEVIKQFGKDSEEAKLNIISVTKLKGEGGNLSIGFGLWPKATKPYGMDKGNSQRNMANIHSERQAMDRLPGKPMPRVEVIDEAYAEIPDIKRSVDLKTGEITEDEPAVEGEFSEVPEPEVKASEVPMSAVHQDLPEPEREPAKSEDKPAPGPTPKNLKELLEWVSSHGKDYGPTWLCKELNVSATSEIADINEAYLKIKEVMNW